MGLKSFALSMFFFSLLFACIKRGQRAGGDSSVLTADVVGMNPGDESLEGIAYQLICKRSQGDSYRVDGTPRPNTSTVDFPDQNISVGDSCALEISALARSGDLGPYQWLAKKGGQTIEGLFYSSDLSTVKLADVAGKLTKVLSFKLFKTYSTTYLDPFTVAIVVDLEVEDGVQVPKENGLLASLVCQEGTKDFVESSEEVRAPSTNQRKFLFRLSASRMKQLSCSHLVIAVDQIPTFKATLSEVRFTDPKTGDSYEKDMKLNFGPFKAVLTLDRFGYVDCLVKNAENRCTAVSFDQTSPVWFAIVQATERGSNTAGPIIVAKRFEPEQNTKSVSVAEMNIQLANQTLSAYPMMSQDTILSRPYEPQQLQAALNGQAYSNPANFTVVSIDHAYRYGFKTVTPGYLDSVTAPRWFAHVHAVKGSESIRFLVGGGIRYFLSSSKPAVTTYFDLEHFRRNQKASDTGYRSYAYQGSGFSLAACNRDLSYFTETVGSKTATLIATSDVAIDQCEILDESKIAPYLTAEWKLSSRIYLWSWHKFSF